MIERFFEAFPLFDFRYEGMGWVGSTLFALTLIFAFGYMPGKTKKR